MGILQILSQMLPLIVFIIVDSIFNDVKVSIVSSIIFAIGQLIFFYFKTASFDWFVLIDVALIIGLGTISIILKNELFFKVKPAIIEASVIIFFIVLIVLPDQFLTGYFGRMMPKGMVLRPGGVVLIKKMLIWTCLYISLHICAVLYTAFYASRRVWAFVSGPGFYLLFIPVIPIIIVRNFKKKKATNFK